MTSAAALLQMARYHVEPRIRDFEYQSVDGVGMVPSVYRFRVHFEDRHTDVVVTRAEMFRSYPALPVGHRRILLETASEIARARAHLTFTRYYPARLES